MAESNTLSDWATWAFSPTISAIIVTLLISLISPVLVHYFLYRKSSSKDIPSFLLIGPSGAGKTSLLTLLANGTVSNTHTSQEPQSALCQLPTATRSSDDRYRSEHDTSARTQPSFLLLDTPGHGKLRHHALSSLTSPTALKGVIFVLDSAAVSSSAGLTEAAEYLHDILLLFQKRRTGGKETQTSAAAVVPVLVAANKQDVFTSLPAGLVKTKLEEEIGKVRMTRSKGLLDSGIGMEDDSAGQGEEESQWLGEFGAKRFGFEQMGEHGVEVAVVGGNVRGEGNEVGVVKEWWDWIGENS